MKKLLICSLLLAATPLFAQRRMDVFFDVEGVRRTGSNRSFSPGVRFEPSFQTGGGVGGGLNFFFSDRLSLETKISGLATKMRLRIVGSDSITNFDLGWAQIYPISAVVQWHPIEHGTIRPYVGGGVVHTILHNINKKIPGSTATGVHFHDPNGIVVDGGLEFFLGSRWSLFGDARYVPMESNSTASFPGTASSVKMSVRPLIVSFGASYHF